MFPTYTNMMNQPPESQGKPRGIIDRLLSSIGRISQPNDQHSRRDGSLESRQTGSCGGMSSIELKIRIELVLDDPKTKLPIIEFANELAGFSHSLQSSFLVDLTRVSESSYEHACQLLSIAAPALKAMDQEQYQQWVGDIKHLLAENDEKAASEIISNYSTYADNNERNTEANLGKVISILDKLVISIHKEPLAILTSNKGASNYAYTDGQQLFLPQTVSYFDNYEDNYRLYKILLFHLVGQIQCHTWQVMEDLKKGIEKHGQEYLSFFAKIETLRIDHMIKQDFPGIWRNIESLNNKLDIDYPDHIFKEHNHTSVTTSLLLSSTLLDQINDFPDLIYQPNYIPSLVSSASGHTTEPPVIMNQTENMDDLLKDKKNNNQPGNRVYLRNNPQSVDSQNDNLRDDGHNLWQELPNQPDSEETHQDDPPLQSRYHEDDTYYYDEWDISLQKYRKDWCLVREVQVENVPDSIKLEHDSSMKYIEHRIKKSFDLLINEQKFIRYQSDGDEIDIDAWIAARSNPEKNADEYQQLYIRNNKNTRNVAIMFAVDISGSTSGWKNTAIKQSTSLLCKVLTRLDDQNAVYAFSGSGRENCQVYPIKTFVEPYSYNVKKRIASMQPQQYTRMGASIRHLSKTLGLVSAKTKILFVLTDGKPDDTDSYRGNYGIEDTRRAILEAKALGLNPYVLTFDRDGLDYLPHMLGSSNYQLVTDISQLAVQISSIYKQLTG